MSEQETAKRSGAAGGGLQQPRRPRVPAAQRREALIEAAVHEFAHGGLHGTPVEHIAQRVGVAQPYVFALFGSKRELFLAAVDRGFERVAQAFRTAAADYAAGESPQDCEDVLMAMGLAYKRLLASDRDCLMLQHQSYAACDEEVVRERVRHRYALLVQLARELSGASEERLDQFFGRGMALNVAAAMGVSELSADAPWVCEELQRARNAAAAQGDAAAVQGDAAAAHRDAVAAAHHPPALLTPPDTTTG